MHIFREIHKWLSIPVGVIISTICITGAILALQEEMICFLNRDVAYVQEVGEKVIPIEQLASKINSGMDDGSAVASLNISGDARMAYRFRLNDEDGAFVYADQYTGLVSTPRHQMRFFNTVRRLHRFLLDTRPEDGGIFWGKVIVGVCTLLFVAIIISGIVVWWPKRCKKLSRKFRIRLNKGFVKFNFDLHCNASIYVMVMLLAMSLTGLTWSFGWYKTAFYGMFGVEDPKTEGVHARQHKQKKEQDVLALCKAWDRAYTEISSIESHKAISFSGNKAELQLSDYGNMRAKDTYVLDADGSIKDVKSNRDTAKADRIKGWIATIHRGTFGGIFTKIIWAIAALVGGLMPITGYILWLRRIDS